MKTVDVGKEFYSRLTNRDKSQGDSKHTAVQFRKHYLSELDNPDAWKGTLQPYITLDFANVEVLAPSFANEAFAHFTKYASARAILQRILMANITDVKKHIIEIELEAGSSR